MPTILPAKMSFPGTKYAAYSHLTFQVIGSRLKPGCAEGRIVSTAIDLMRRSGQ
jgi:hypothetical protein